MSESTDKQSKTQELKHLVQCAYDGHNINNVMRYSSCWKKIVELIKELGDNAEKIIGNKTQSKQGLKAICKFYGFDSSTMDRKIGL